MDMIGEKVGAVLNETFDKLNNVCSANLVDLPCFPLRQKMEPQIAFIITPRFLLPTRMLRHVAFSDCHKGSLICRSAFGSLDINWVIARNHRCAHLIGAGSGIR
jgi:hypothetical protein